MISRDKLKQDVNVSSAELIDFLKQEKLYIQDNGVEQTTNNVSALENSNQTSLSWIDYENYNLKKLDSSILIVSKEFKEKSSQKSIIYTSNPILAIVQVLNQFFMEIHTGGYIADSASIDQSAKIGKNCIINENVVIAQNVVLGDNVTLYPDVVLYPNTIVKDNVIINSGTKIGQEGYGYIKDAKGQYIQFPHIGKVILEKGVEIGANTCIDRGALSDTVIGENTKIDNFCHISHNCRIGKNCLMAGKAGMAGSTIVEDNVFLGPRSSLMNGITIGANSIITAVSLIRKSVKPNTTMVPFEALEQREYIKTIKKMRA